MAEERISNIRNEIEAQMSQASVLKARINTEKEGIKSIGYNKMTTSEQNFNVITFRNR
jgi:(p)ppGpp synthase/HD superfamily hydrolase